MTTFYESVRIFIEFCEVFWFLKMADLSIFKEFLSSFSRVTSLRFELWDGQSALLSSEGSEERDGLSSELAGLAQRVMNGAGVQTLCQEGGRDVFAVPVRSGEEVVGALLASYPSPGGDAGQVEDFRRNMEIFLVRVASLMEDRMTAQQETQQMAEELSRSFEDLYLYSTISVQVKTMHFTKVMLRDLIRDLLETMRSDLAFAVLPDREEYCAVSCTRNFVAMIPDGAAFARLLIERIPADAPSLGDNYFIVNDSRTDDAYGSLHPDPYRFLAVKISHGSTFYGWLGMFSFNLKEIFRRGELKLLSSIAEQIAIGISNADLYSDLENLVKNVVKSLVSTIEAKDTYTRGHSDRVHNFSLMMAEALALDDEQQYDLSWASILHDIGKIGIPESILNKPGRLSEEEYDIVKKHPEQGDRILKPLKQLLSSLPGVLHHHERYDGMGYPEGLKGEDIPLMARIIAVADTFDAITSARAYRGSKSSQQALAIMEEVAGTQLDQGLVKVFKDMYDRGAIEKVGKPWQR